MELVLAILQKSSNGVNRKFNCIYIKTLVMNENKKDPKAAVRNRGKVVFPAASKKVKDDKDHFPINDEGEARNALSRANQYDKAPSWFDGSKQELVDKVVSMVKNHYPSIDVSKDSEKAKVNESENISEFAQRMRELAGLSEGNQKKRLKTIEEGESTFDGETVFTAKDLMEGSKEELENPEKADLDKDGKLSSYEKKRGKAIEKSLKKESKEKFEVHTFEQSTIEEGESDELYTLNEDTIIVLDFLNEDKKS